MSTPDFLYAFCLHMLVNGGHGQQIALGGFKYPRLDRGGDLDACGAADHRDLCPFYKVDNGQGGGGGGWADNGQDFILVQQLVHRGDGLARIPLGVINYRLQHDPVNTAGGIDLVNHHLHGLFFRIA